MTDDCRIGDVLAFWRGAGQERWYTPDANFDAAVRDRYFALLQEAVTSRLSSWEANDDGTLALVIVLDQFTRNMFRGEAKAFSGDALAREVASRALVRGVDQRIEPPLRQFLYLPFMHSENLADQIRCVELFRADDNAENLKYAETHADIIRRFGRFPHRNRILGRLTTLKEQAFLDAGGFSG